MATNTTTRPDVFIFPPDADDPVDIHWTVSGDIASKVPGWSNYDVEEAVQDLLPPGEKFFYDTELGCFFGYTLNEDDAKQMVAAIERVVQRPLTVGPIEPVDDDEDPQSALLLTESEWKDLANILSAYRSEVGSWLKHSTVDPRHPSVAGIHRQYALATRIIEAAS